MAFGRLQRDFGKQFDEWRYSTLPFLYTLGMEGTGDIVCDSPGMPFIGESEHGDSKEDTPITEVDWGHGPEIQLEGITIPTLSQKLYARFETLD